MAPGGRVEVGFIPRADDRWPVAGRLPQALPAGRASGRQLILQRNGSTWVPPKAEERSRRVPAVARSAPGQTLTVVDAARLRSVAVRRPSIGAPARDASQLESQPDLARASTPTGGSPIDPSARVGVGLRREVFGFLPYWLLGASSTRLDYTALSTVAYFGVGATRTGQLLKRNSDGTPTTGWAGWTSSRLTSIINEAHRGGTRVVLTVQRFSWSSGETADTVALLSSSSARRALANEIAAAVRDRGADGVNLDFEPIPSGQSANFVTFVRELRAALNARALGYQLTFDATGRIGNYDIAALTAPGAADAVFIMGYPYRGKSSAYAGSIAPLAGPLYDLTDTVKAYLARTSPAKIILGVPYYGRAWSTVSDALNAATRPEGSTYGYSSNVPYYRAAELAAIHGRRYDGVEQSPWTAYQYRNCTDCPLTWRELYYDDVRSLGAKYDLVNFRALRGAGIWALGYDGTRTELYSLLKAKFVEDRTPPAAGIKVLASVSREEGISVDWVAVDEYSGIDAYDVQVSKDGGAWAPWLVGTRAGAGTYLAESGHGYAFRVRARDGKGNWSPWNVSSTWTATPRLAVGGFGRVAAATLTMRSTPSTSASSVGSLAAGDIVAVTGGPSSGEGYIWYQVTAPLREWAPVGWSVQRGVWVAAGSGTSSYLVAAQAPNSTKVDAYIRRVAAGAVDTVTLTGASSSTPQPSGPDAFSPNGDGAMDALRVTYTLASSLDNLTLRVYRLSDRTLLGERPLPGTAAGDHAYDWDGRLGGTVVPDGPVLLQLAGAVDGVRYAWPAPSVSDPVLNVAPLRVTVDTTPPTFAAVVAAPRPFSPNGDGIRDALSVRATASNGAVAWRIRIAGAAGTVRSFTGTGAGIAATWNGRNDAGVRVADGAYAVFVTVVDGVHNARSVGLWVGVDTVPPRGSAGVAVPGVAAGATGNSFSPDGDGSTDTSNLAWNFSERAAGTMEVRN
ncbi:MAG: glycosyl hydrolase family 18 protein, partial [Chloroflexota bacterium]|nr:glycosyl hydrolase family 18 protein [Chloroflexota bacterium]